VALALFYAYVSFARLEIFKMIIAVLGAIVFGLATPTEAAAMGSMSGLVCGLSVGSSIFSAAFALLGGQKLINTWVLSLNMTPVQLMILAQVVIFIPIFTPLLPHFGIDPLFFGLLVALNLQTAFLNQPVAMTAFYLKGVNPQHVTLNQIFAGMLPFIAIQVLAIVLL
jgi:TRAP-type mannitol/chloroaromatic compound transport system permease large subunit